MRKLRVVMPLAAMMAVMMLMPTSGHAASVTASDGELTTINPITVKSDAQTTDPTLRPLFRAGSETDSGNITSFTMTTVGQNLQFDVTTEGPILQCPGPYPRTTPCTFPNLAPYAGAHVLVLFQVPNQNQITPIGCSNVACTGQSQWNPIHPSDRFYLGAYYGVTSSGSKEDVSVAIYDPTGRVNKLPLEPGVGQLFSVMGQKNQPLCTGLQPNSNAPSGLPGIGTGSGNNTSYSFLSSNTIRFTIPYHYAWRNSPTASFPCGYRHKQIVTSGQQISNAVAFTWMDHEVGTPETGLIVGWTWYSDSVPRLGTPTGYKVGTPSGDPNFPNYAGPACPVVTQSVANPLGGPDLVPGGNKNPLFNPAAPCTIPNPVGPGFGASGLNLVAG